ncbi:MAG: DUF58 domain-containing protein [Chloroflexi bacterium]|nr:DUF58 domain-containing protein [Chloroflexota bacterium]
MLNQLWHDLWIMVFVILIVIGVFSGQGLVIGFGAMGLLVAGISWMWNKLSLQDVTYERELSQQRVFIGEEVTMNVVLTNRKPIPLGRLRAEDEMPKSVNIANAHVVSSYNPESQTLCHSTSMGWYDRIRWQYQFTCSKRGFFRLGPVHLESGDLFGLFSSHANIRGDDYILVYPRVVSLPELGLPYGRPLGDSKDGMRIYEDASRPMGLRDYQLGDPLKTVDWKATARMQQLQVRTFEPSSSMTLILVVAVDTTAHYWEGYSPVYLERVITAAASMATYAYEQQYSVGLFSNGTPVLADRPMRIPPSRSPEQLSIILEALATVRPIAMGPMDAQLGDNWQQFAMGATIVVVSGYISEEMTNVLRRARASGYRIVVLFVGDEECPQLAAGIVVHQLNEHFAMMELENEFAPG